jgi:Uma2 family endonuclease
MTAMTADVAPHRITADEFLAGDFPTGSELVEGLVHVMDPAFDHQEVCLRLLFTLNSWALERKLGRPGYGGNWVLSDRNVYKPDVWWTRRPPSGTRHPGPPELAVEVRSPSTWALDVGPKLRRYDEAGTRELWLVDLPVSTVLVFRRVGDDAAFDDGVDVGPGDTLTSPLLPGFALPIDELFADLP